MPEDISPYKGCLLIVRRKYVNRKTRANDSVDTLLIYNGGEVIGGEPK